MVKPLEPRALASGRQVIMPSTDILVVGSGPVGLAAALKVAAMGYRVAIVAPATRPDDHRTAALLAGSVDFLDSLGVWPLVKDQSAPLRSLRIVDATRRLIRAPEVLFHASEIGLDAFGYNIANAALTAGLDRLCRERGIERIEASVERIAVTGDDAVVAHLDTGETVTARLVAAADGRRSRVRDSIGIAEWDWRYDQSALVTNIRHTLPHHETSTEFHTEGGPFTLVPLPGQRSSLVWVDRPAEAKRRAALAPEVLAAEIEARAQSMLGKVALDGPAQVFPLSGMGVRAFAAQRAVLLGEAAHLFPPIGAQGLNLGYSDVATLGESLAGHPEDPGEASRLAAYDRSRRADIYARTAAVDALNRTLLTGFLPVQAVRGLGLFLLDRIPALRRAVMLRGVGSPASPPASETDRPAGRRSTGSSG
ncbi:2-octaprenyl-6-methoxyphenol hydroxylase [Bauldia litoralis]|uniref:2-octaprenyl-6-methoxyphenol hydroxylase n=2 Tax=Bauldia litoralis TaxID=665467 RepID=A0A1G6B1L1_9HYPH|nr:2-octaprenyl-6-methoxyphenol hydroxylase [Bauldia litoralis]